MSSHFPQNLPYIQGTSKNAISKNTSQCQIKQVDKGQVLDSQFLMGRIQDLQKQLVSLSTLLTQDGGFQQAYDQLQQQNEQLKAIIREQNVVMGEAKQLQISNQMLKQNLLKQNQEMQELYKQLVQAKNSQSRMQERGQSQYLQSKVQELNDQISNLLLKIQQLVEQNNQQQTNQHQMSQEFQTFTKQFNQKEAQLKNLQVQNQILKDQIHNMEQISMSQQKQIQDRYMKQMEDLIEQINELKSSLQAKPSNINNNTSRMGEDRLRLQQEIIALKAQLASKNEQLLWQKENEVHLRRKWEERLVNSENELRQMNEVFNNIRGQLRREQNKRSQLQFALQQHQNERKRLNFYKSNYSQTEQLRNTIVRLQAEKEQLRMRIERLQAQFSQVKLQPIKQVYKNPVNDFMHEQTQEQLMNSKKLNKELKLAISKYEEDYRCLRRDYEKLVQEKCEAQRVVQTNQLQLNKHKAIYEQLTIRYNQTALLYKEVEVKLRMLQAQRTSKIHYISYDKQDVQLIKLENSALRQQIAHLKQQISSKRPTEDIHDLKEECAQSKRRQRQCAQQLQIYRQKYLRQLQKSQGNKQLQSIVSDLQDKLARVNRMLNEKLKEVQYLHSRQKQLVEEVDNAYLKCKIQFDHYGIKHHPQIKRLQAQLLSAQRQIMESQLVFKQQINNSQDELRLSRLQNQHHRAKIDELLLQVNKQRSNLGYSKIMRSLELSTLTEKELRRQIDHRDNLINDLREELKRNQSRQRSRVEGFSKSHLDQIKIEKDKYQKKCQQYQLNLRDLNQVLNRIEGRSSQDNLRRAINLISKLQTNKPNLGLEGRQNSYSRYEQLARKKAEIASHFKQSQKLLYGQKLDAREQRSGIFSRLRQNIAT